MTWNEMVTALLDCAATLYHIDGAGVFNELSSDGDAILDGIDINEMADKLELIAKVMFCDRCDTKDLRRFLKGELK